MTMSISSAPSSTADRTSATLIAVGYWPDGNPVATAATFTPLSPSRSRTARDEVRIDAHRRARGTVGSDGSGRRAFDATAAALPGVSAPSSVVRSVVRIASCERPDLRVLLDRALRERRGALLERDRVDCADPRQPRLERQLEPRRQCRSLRHGVESSPGQVAHNLAAETGGTLAAAEAIAGARDAGRVPSAPEPRRPRRPRSHGLLRHAEVVMGTLVGATQREVPHAHPQREDGRRRAPRQRLAHALAQSRRSRPSSSTPRARAASRSSSRSTRKAGSSSVSPGRRRPRRPPT